MTTLSKEDTEKLWWQSNQDIFIFAVLARADLVAENGRLRDEDDARYIHSCGPKCMRAGCVNRRLRTALAAAEARERKLCKAIVLFRNEKAVGRAGSVRATEGYAAMQYAVFDQPCDDSALREMIAADRERICTEIKAEDDRCVTEGDYMLDSNDCIAIVRGEWKRPDFCALAEKAKGE